MAPSQMAPSAAMPLAIPLAIQAIPVAIGTVIRRAMAMPAILVATVVSAAPQVIQASGPFSSSVSASGSAVSTSQNRAVRRNVHGVHLALDEGQLVVGTLYCICTNILIVVIAAAVSLGLLSVGNTCVLYIISGRGPN